MESVSDQKLAVQTSWQIRAVWIAVLCCTASCGALTTRALTSADADTLFDAHTKAFYQEKDGRAWFKESTDGGKVSYWIDRTGVGGHAGRVLDGLYHAARAWFVPRVFRGIEQENH